MNVCRRLWKVAERYFVPSSAVECVFIPARSNSLHMEREMFSVSPVPVLRRAN